MSLLPRGPEPHEWDAHMTADDAMARMVERTGLAVWANRAAEVASVGDAVLDAARELYDLSLAGADLDSDIWLQTQGRLFDLVRQLPIDLVPASLLANRAAEVERVSSQAGVASFGPYTVPLYITEQYPHDDGDCHGSRCDACGCCMHSTSACAAWDLPQGQRCGGTACGCVGRS